ncbi:MAG TPA: FHA domain-containing protein [Anaeromyxobacteraceae bacterium]|nr:FHA domain-containing protein [Anaeromyxobacteraceae bacterium]
MRSYLLSWLTSKYAALPMDTFVRAQRADWLVWEAGPWRPPVRTGETLVAGGQPPIGGSSTTGESLAIELAAKDGALSIGRGGGNDVLIDDATLSRVHLLLDRGPDGTWRARDAGSSNGTKVNGQRIGADPVALVDGSAIEAGAVRLTFYAAEGMWLRLRMR